MIGKLGTQLSDIKLWRKDLDAPIAAMDSEAFRSWVVSQLRDNLAPLLEAEVRALSHELGEVNEAVNELGDVVNEMIDREGSFLQPEVGTQLSSTLQIGLQLCELVEGLKYPDEFTARKAANLIREYKQQALISLDEIEQIMADEIEIEDEDEGEDEDARSGLHDESENLGGAKPRGADETGAGRRTGPARSPQSDGGE